MDLRPALYGMDREEVKKLVAEEKAPSYRTDQILTWLYQGHIALLEEAKNLPAGFRKKIAERFDLTSLRPSPPSLRGGLSSSKAFIEDPRLKHAGMTFGQIASPPEDGSADSRAEAASQPRPPEDGSAVFVADNDKEAEKFLFETRDGHLLESVLISQAGRETVCVSTQLGCKIGCIFCASGKGRFGRNLTAGEIVEQVAWIARQRRVRLRRKRGLGRVITNVVFMGMGEPLDNFEATMKALKILQAPWGFGLGARRITVSTSGITPKIVEFVKRSEGRVRLSVSLHSSKEQKRTELVPINKRYSLKNLKETLAKIHRDLKREITFEYTLIAGVNDSHEEAEGVAKIAKPLRAKVNLIPYNPIHEMDFKTPSRADVEAFRDILQGAGVHVTVRQTAGRDIDAACGQLRLDREREPSFPKPV